MIRTVCHPPNTTVQPAKFLMRSYLFFATSAHTFHPQSFPHSHVLIALFIDMCWMAGCCVASQTVLPFSRIRFSNSQLHTTPPHTHLIITLDATRWSTAVFLELVAPQLGGILENLQRNWLLLLCLLLDTVINFTVFISKVKCSGLLQFHMLQ